MALPVRKGYNGAPANAVLTNNPGADVNTDTTFIVDTTTNWGSVPFFCVVDPGTSREEKVKVTAKSGVNLTVVRASDNTSVFSHSASAVIYPVFTATEADEANQIASVMTTKGDIISTNGSSINRLGVGTNTYVLQADSASTNGIKWGQVETAGIATGAVTSDKILDGTIVAGDLADGAVTSAKILNATIVAGDLADAAVTSPKLAAPTLTEKLDSFTLALVDANCTMQCNKATAMTVTVPTSSVAFANGTVITLVNYGAGQVTVAGDTGVTVRSGNGLKLRIQWSMASLVKISNTEWVLSGDTVVA